MDIQAIYQEAHKAAVNAENTYLAQHGESAYCGFGWVDVSVDRTNSTQAQALLSVGFRKSYRPKTLNMWTCGDYHGQSMDVKEQGARAFAEVLVKHGFRASMGSRAD